MPRGVPNARTAVLDAPETTFIGGAGVYANAPTDYDPNLVPESDGDEYLDAIGQSESAVTFPIRAYNLKHEMERVLIPDKNPGKSDPELRKRIQFFAGSVQVRTQEEYDALATKSGVVFDNFPKGAADHECPRCKRPFRNMQAFDAHVLTHME